MQLKNDNIMSIKNDKSVRAASKGFYIKAYNIPINTFKSVFFNRLKYRFHSILITQITDPEKYDRCTHHIAIQNETRVTLIKF